MKQMRFWIIFERSPLGTIQVESENQFLFDLPATEKMYENDALLKDHFCKVKERYGFEMKTW